MMTTELQVAADCLEDNGFPEQAARLRAPSCEDLIAELARMRYRMAFFPYGEGVSFHLNPYGDEWRYKEGVFPHGKMRETLAAIVQLLRENNLPKDFWTETPESVFREYSEFTLSALASHFGVPSAIVNGESNYASPRVAGVHTKGV